MNDPTLAARTALLVALGLFASGGVALAQVGPPATAEPQLTPSEPITGPLAAQAKTQIGEYLQYWTGKLKAAKTYDDADRARTRLDAGYDASTSAFWKYEYANQAATTIVDVFNGGTKLGQIHAAMALASMPQVTILPALQSMAQSKDPAVRYSATRGYRGVAKAVMDQGGQYVTRMLSTLETLGKDDPSGVVVGGVFRALAPYAGARANDIRRLRTAQDTVWLARLGEILAAKLDFVNGYNASLRYVTPAGQGDQTDQKAVLQMLADLLEVASTAFMKNYEGRKGVVFRDLLMNIEIRLGTILQTNQTPIAGILSKKEITAEMALKVRLEAVNETWKPILAKMGITPRPVQPSSSRPSGTATQPAG